MTPMANTAAAEGAAQEAKRRSVWAQTLRMLVRRRIVTVGIGLVVGGFLVAVLAPLLTFLAPILALGARRLRRQGCGHARMLFSLP